MRTGSTQGVQPVRGWGGRTRGELGAVTLAAVLLLSGVVTAGAGVGVVLDQTGVLGGRDATTVAAPDTVSIVQCPSGPSIGSLRRGDRVLATGRTSDHDWVQIRDPRDLSARVWVARSVVIPDGSLTGLPVRSCVIPTTTTTTAPPAAPTTTTSTTRGSTTGTTTAPAPAPADTTGPTIGGISTTAKEIWTLNQGSQQCGASQPSTASISASVSDSSGVLSVSMSWSPALGSPDGASPKTMTNSNGLYTASLGRFAQSSVGLNGAALTVTITAKDNAGNTSTATVSGGVTLSRCK